MLNSKHCSLFTVFTKLLKLPKNVYYYYFYLYMTTDCIYYKALILNGIYCINILQNVTSKI